MEKKAAIWKTKGMNRDLSVSAFNSEFSFENHNLRLSTNDDNTLMSWVNERGPMRITLDIDIEPWKGDSTPHTHSDRIAGRAIGSAVLDHQLVLFTVSAVVAENAAPPDRIYVLHYTDATQTAMEGKLIYHGNLNFNYRYPLETLVSYEAEYIQKVYWTDGLNQPRLINIAASRETLSKWHDDLDAWEAFSANPVSSLFDFVPAIHRIEYMTIRQSVSESGTFAPGVIQYCFTYINKYGQQSNIVQVSPQYYLAYADRGASPEERVTCTFDIGIFDPDRNFDKVRIYSIQQTSVNTAPIVKLLSDVEPKAYTERGSGGQSVTKYKVEYTDNGTTGTIIDPYELLYAGGKEISALTMKDKDNTLFLGNIKEKRSSVKNIQKYINEKVEQRAIGISFGYDTEKTMELDAPTGYYPYTPSWRIKLQRESGYYDGNIGKNQAQVTTFKGGENYRFGFQLQKRTGEWSEPIFLEDATNGLYPKMEKSGNTYTVGLVSATCSLDFNPSVGDDEVNPFDDEFWDTYTRVRPVIVYPNIQDRKVVAQGVLAPTVFNVEDRMDNSPYAQASWFFRPYIWDDEAGVFNQAYLGFEHYEPLENGGGNYASEIQGAQSITASPYYKIDETLMPNGKMVSNTEFFVDHSIVTFNSPDLEFDTATQSAFVQDMKMRIVGMVPITSLHCSYSLETSTAMLPIGFWDDGEWNPLSPALFNTLVTEFMPIGFPYYVKDFPKYGAGDLKVKVGYENLTATGRRLCAAYLWQDVMVFKKTPNDDHPEGVDSSYLSFNFMVYPWQRNGSLNSDPRKSEEASSVLKTKKESTLSYSYCSEYFDSHGDSTPSYGIHDFGGVLSKVHLTENQEVFNYRLYDSMDTGKSINYYPNVDKLLYNTMGYHSFTQSVHYPNGSKAQYEYIKKVGGIWENEVVEGERDKQTYYDPILMKYKSTTHAVIGFNEKEFEGEGRAIPILPYPQYTVGGILKKSGEFDPNAHTGTDRVDDNNTTYWGEVKTFHQDHIDITDCVFHERPLLWLAEVYKEAGNPFGSPEDEVKKNTWLIAGEDVPIYRNTDNTRNGLNRTYTPIYEEETNSVPPVELKWSWGDTFFQRYDCLKTYAFSDTDTNQIVEILSFMCETHVNIDGRYDRNRGQLKNYNMSPEVFNRLNDAYSQQANFFSYRQVDLDQQDTQEYPNQITYTKTKVSGADVDLWANITLASVLEMDGDKGEVTSLQRINDSLVAFQDSGISQILYNENVQISAQNGVPIEIANSGKVQGKRYISDTVGCSNKWSIVQTPQGLYFMDSNNKNIYLFNGQLANLSASGGMNSWSKENIPSYGSLWDPIGFQNFVSYYDRQNNDVMFINRDTCLDYSERVGAFTSFYDYGDTPYFCNLDDTGIWVKHMFSPSVSMGTGSVLYKHQAGAYGAFFGEHKPYFMTLVGNPEPTMDKLFTNLEFRASVDNSTSEGTWDGSSFTPLLPFDKLETWNEYQHGIALLKNLTGTSAMQHHTPDTNASLKRKFRIWRNDIPRDNAPVDATTENAMGIYRNMAKPFNRMRNPWVYLRLTKEAAPSGATLPRTEIHDIMMHYWK